MIVIVDDPAGDFLRRALAFDTTGLPVACDLIVHSVGEWAERQRKADRFATTMAAETHWLARRSDGVRAS